MCMFLLFSFLYEHEISRICEVNVMKIEVEIWFWQLELKVNNVANFFSTWFLLQVQRRTIGSGSFIE